MNNLTDKKSQHIQLALKSKVFPDQIDRRFVYEPLFAPHPVEYLKPFDFLGKQMKFPMWVSSMTGGTGQAKRINFNIAKVCHDFGMGMSLGSCRRLIDDRKYFDQYNVRPVLGNDLPLYANLGVAQVQKHLDNKTIDKVQRMIDNLKADGLVVHVNPFQEFVQPEGTCFDHPPVETIRELLETAGFNVIVKEVGQGMGPRSVHALLDLPLAALEFGAAGGTNFTMVEQKRAFADFDPVPEQPLTFVGHDASEMVEQVNNAVQNGWPVSCKEIIIGGGVRSFLDGYYLTEKCELPAIYAQASEILRYAMEDYAQLYAFVDRQVKGFRMAQAYLKIRKNEANKT